MNSENQTVQDYIDFGYKASNPILAASIPYANHYMSSLQFPDAKQLKYSRLGADIDSNKNILDVYAVDIEMNDGKQERFILYINPYAHTTSKIAPMGFVLSQKTSDIPHAAKKEGGKWTKFMRKFKKRLKQ